MKKTTQTERPKIALFDFDGTLTKKDSFLEWLKHTHGISGITQHLLYLWPALLLYKLKIISNTKAKRLVFRQFYCNWPVTFFQEKATVFCAEVLPQILNPEAITKLRWHQQQGHKVIVVSAMFSQVLQDWCTQNNLTLLATELEINNGFLTGRFASENCYGKEKTTRIMKTGLLQAKPYIYAYGDSEGDKEMLALADEAFYRKF